MAAIKLNQIYGGRGFVPTELGTSQSYSLSSATSPLVLTPPAGKVIRLDSLNINDDSILNDVYIEVGGNEVVRGILQVVTIGVSRFNIGKPVYSNANGGFAANSAAKDPIIAFEPDQSISISTTDSTPQLVYFSVTYGDLQ